MNTQTIQLDGLYCDACVITISRRIKRIPGVMETKVSLEKQTAEITSKRNIEKTEFVQALSGTHYEVKE